MSYKVGDEFVIRIGEKYNTTGVVNVGSETTNKPNCLYRAEGFNALTFDDNGLDKLDRLNDDYINEHYEMFQDAAYQKGLEEGKKQQEKADIEMISEYKNGSYQDGLSDAWEAVKKIFLPEKNGGYSCEELEEIFGLGSYIKVLEKYTASKALEKIREYEEKRKAEKEIKIGDEISYQYAGENTKGVVVQCIHIDEGGYKVICKNGCGQIIYNKGTYHIKKTGRHFPQIAEVLEQMKEEAE